MVQSLLSLVLVISFCISLHRLAFLIIVSTHFLCGNLELSCLVHLCKASVEDERVVREPYCLDVAIDDEQDKER